MKKLLSLVALVAITGGVNVAEADLGVFKAEIAWNYDRAVARLKAWIAAGHR